MIIEAPHGEKIENKKEQFEKVLKVSQEYGGDKWNISKHRDSSLKAHIELILNNNPTQYFRYPLNSEELAYIEGYLNGLNNQETKSSSNLSESVTSNEPSGS